MPLMQRCGGQAAACVVGLWKSVVWRLARMDKHGRFDAVERRTDCHSQAFGSTLDRLKKRVQPSNLVTAPIGPQHRIGGFSTPISRFNIMDPGFRRAFSRPFFQEAIPLKVDPKRENESGSKDAVQAHFKQRFLDSAERKRCLTHAEQIRYLQLLNATDELHVTASAPMEREGEREHRIGRWQGRIARSWTQRLLCEASEAGLRTSHDR
jgi:hypothetical protein